MSEISNEEPKSEISELMDKDIFIQGKKFYIVGNYTKSVEYLAKACKLLESKYGDFSSEMFEPYYYLAKGYYMYCKQETSLLADGMEIQKQNNTEKTIMINTLTTIDEEDEGEEIKDNEHENVNSDVDRLIKGDGPEKNEGDEQSETAGSKDVQEEKEHDNNEKEEQGVKEDLTYLQLAYETMECAKVILNRQIAEMEEKNEESKEKLVELMLKLADCCDVVGNIYMEEGVLNEAIEEYNRALELRKTNSKDNSKDRSIAESYFNIAMAYCIDGNSKSAIDNYEHCKSIMEACKLRAIETKDEDGAHELEEIIADINDKIIDCQEGERDYKLAKESIKEFLLTPNSGFPVTDVSHLVRRKSTGEEPSAKRFKKSDD